jgi:hypothetical protein
LIGAASIATASWPGPGSAGSISASSTTSVGEPKLEN